MQLTAIEIVEDRTAAMGSDQGFLRVRRLIVRNRYDDGSAGELYNADVMTRPSSDAVVAVLYERTPGGLEVLLREAPRVPIYLRKDDERRVHPDLREYLSLHELVAGMVEADDAPGLRGLAHRAAREAEEEAGLELDEASFRLLGGETFASPGVTDEKLYFLSAAAPLAEAQGGQGDGSAMEEWGLMARLDLREAIRRCRDGRIPDMKTEIGLLRLADRLGYLAQLGCFAHELPAGWAERFDPLGVTPLKGDA